MKLIVGLGNPGEKYQNNRHNAGFMFINYLIDSLAGFRVSELKKQKFENSELAKLVINNQELLFTKPLTFMNNSGTAVSELFKNYKLKIENLVVIHDDLDIPLGKFKIQLGTGPKLHNGLESIENHLHLKDFLRVRIGVDNRKPENWINGETYTLQDFTVEERKIIDQTFSQILDRMKKDNIV